MLSQQPRLDDLGPSVNCPRPSTFDSQTKNPGIRDDRLIVVDPRRCNASQSMCRSAVPNVIPFWDKGDGLLRDRAPESRERCDWSAYPESFSNVPQKAEGLLGTLPHCSTTWTSVWSVLLWGKAEAFQEIFS